MCTACTELCILYTLQSGVDIMHTVDLGVWVHLLTCIAVKYDQVARKYNVLKAAEVSAIWDELGRRVRLLDPDLCMFKLNEYKGNFLKFCLMERQDSKSNKKNKAKKKKFEAWEHHILMNVSIVYSVHHTVHTGLMTFSVGWVVQALPFLLKDLIKSQVEKINAYNNLRPKPKPPVVDPSDCIQLAIDCFKDFYNFLRQPMTTTDDLKELAQKTYKLQWILKQVFPAKSGLCAVYRLCTVYTM